MLSDARPTSTQYEDKEFSGNYSDDFDEKSINGPENEEAAKNMSGSTSISSGQHSPRNISRHSSEHNNPKEDSHHSSRHSSEHNYPKEHSHHSSRHSSEHNYLKEHSHHSSRHSSEHNYPKEHSHHSSRHSSEHNYPKEHSHHSSRHSSSSSKSSRRSSSSKSSVSGIEKKSESSHDSTADRVFHAIQSLKSKEPKRDGSKVNRKPSRQAKRRKVKSPEPASIPSAECAEAAAIPTTKEELLELLMRNDDLQMQLLEVQYRDRHPSRSRHVDMSHISSKSVTIGVQRQKKMVEVFQQTMRREVKRRNLRDERTFLIVRRNELRMSIAKFKKLSRYETLIESCRNDITRLAAEKRMLLLDIRHNERVLVTNEERQDTNNADKRLVDEIRADDVLTRRALDRARRDALETTKMCNAKRQQVSELEEKLAAAENVQSNQLEGNINELYMHKRKQLEKISRMRQRLRLLKSGASETETEVNAHLQDEREFLRESVNRMEKEVNDLLERQKRRLIICDAIDVPSSIPSLPMKDQRGSSTNKPRLRSGEPSGTPIHRKYESSDAPMSKAKKAVEEHREQQQEQKQQNQYPWEGDALSPGALSRDSDGKPSEPVSTGGMFMSNVTHEYPSEDDETKFPVTVSEEYSERRRSSDGTQQGCRLSPDVLRNDIKPPRCEWEENSPVKSVEDELDYTENRDSYASINVESVQAAAVEDAPAAPNEESSVPSWMDNNETKPLSPPTLEETVTQAVKEEISRDEVIDEAHNDIEDDIVSAKEEEEEKEEEKEEEESAEGDYTAVYEKEEDDSGVNAESADVQKESGGGEEGGPSWLDFE